jgi:septal ring factor EnvC (AmiA/AmiB activator)
LIEIQKARNQIDLMRFRNYLAEQYKKEDVLNSEKVILPITTIYILGFKLPEIETACIKVERNYKDLVNNKTIEKKSDFVEKLTHDSYIVQVDRITNNYSTKLDKLLSIFQQQHFIDDRKITKEFRHQLDSEDIKLTTDILHFAGTNPEERKKIETEQEAWRTVNAMFEDKEKELKAVIDEKDKVINEKDKVLEEMAKELEELKRKLNSKK